MATKALPDNIKTMLWPHMKDWQNDSTQSISANYDNLIKPLTLEEKETLASFVGLKKNDFLKRLSNAWEKDKKKDVFDMFAEKPAPAKNDAMDIDAIAGAFAEPESTNEESVSAAYLQALNEARATLEAIKEAKRQNY